MPKNEPRHDDSYDLLSHYLQEIARVPRLSPERERELGRLVQQENDKAAIEELVRANLRFVVSYAKRFRNAQVQLIDLINEGNIGLMQAARKYDPDKNVKFITYAVWWIRQAILQALSQQGGAFRIPAKRANIMYRMDKMISTAHLEENRMPTKEELAADLGVDVKEVERLLLVNNDNHSLNSEISDEGTTELIDMIEQQMMASAEHEMERQSVRQELLQQMAELTSKERLVLTLRHGLSDNVPRTMQQIADFIGRDEAEVRQIVDAAIVRLCERLLVSESELCHLLLYTNPYPKAEQTFWKLADCPGSLRRGIDPSRLDYLEKLRQHGTMQNEVAALPLDQRTFLELRFGILQDEEMTLRDIGEILNLSRERVRQIEARAEAKCRRTVKRDSLRSM
jgi:RNA polymerase primary sigma factor